MGKDKMLAAFLDSHPEYASKIKEYQKKKAKKEERIQKMWELRQEGFPIRLIGQIFGYTGERVRQILIEKYGQEAYKATKHQKPAPKPKVFVCQQCYGKFTAEQKRKYCTVECRRQAITKIVYPAWVRGRRIKQKNFTADEWRELLRIKARSYYRRNKEKLQKVQKRRYRKNRDKIKIYVKRSQERKKYGYAVTPLPEVKNPYATKM